MRISISPIFENPAARIFLFVGVVINREMESKIWFFSSCDFQSSLQPPLSTMGIAGFTEWFLKTFPRTVTKVGDGRVPADHVLIDFNQFIHKVSRTARNYNVLWKKMYKQLDEILNITNPRQSVYIVMDGPGTAEGKMSPTFYPLFSFPMTL